MVKRILLLTLLAQAAPPGMPAQQPSPAAITGRVVDAGTGKPIAGAIVAVFVRTGGGGSPPTPESAQRFLTNSEGRFEAAGFAPARVGVNVTKSGYSPGGYGQSRAGGLSSELLVSAGERKVDLTIRLWKQAAITGRVVDESGEPLVNVTVRAYTRRGGVDRRWGGVSAAATDDRGVYRLPLLNPGEYVIGIVSRNSNLPFSIADASRGPANSNLQAEIGAGSPGTSSAIRLGDQLYTLPGGAPVPAIRGERAFIYPPVFYPSVLDVAQAARIRLASGEERDGIDLTLQPVAAVRVSGIVSGLPKGTGVPVRLIPGYSSEILVETEPVTVTDPSGSFTFAAVPPGEYLLQTTTVLRLMRWDRARSEDMQFAETPISVGQSDVDGIALQLRPGLRIRGRIEFEGATERPAPGNPINLTIEPAPGPGVSYYSFTATTTDSGAFSSVPLTPGRYYVRVSASPTGWMLKSATLSGRDVADLAIELQNGDVDGVVVTFSDRWSGLSGSVSRSSGAPETDGLVIVFPTDPLTWTGGINPRRVRSVPVLSGGRYTFAVLPPGDYYVAAIPSSQAADWLDAKFLELATRTARRVTIADGERPIQDLRTQEVR